MRGFLAPYHSAIGRPSIDPELMMRMLLVGYCFGVRSERRICDDVHVNLAFRWFFRLDLTEPVLDHSGFSQKRHGRFRDSDLFRHLFKTVLARCIAEGLVGGETFGVDATTAQADAKQLNKVDTAEWAPERVTRAVEEYFETLDAEAFGEATPVKPKVLSPVDPAARFTGAKEFYSIFA
ncbi:MAG: transposase [Pseudomonadota bacterium]